MVAKLPIIRLERREHSRSDRATARESVAQVNCYASAVERITSRQNSVVAQYRSAARGETGDVLLLDGAHLVSDALTARIPLQHVMVAAESQENSDIQPLVARAVAQQTMVAVASAKVMEAASPVRSSSPIIALANRNKLAADVYAARQPFVLIACDVQDPGNLGAITRVAEAAGASGLIAAGQSADPLGWKALRGSMGSALRLPIASCDTVDDAVAQARQHGCRIVATLPRGGTSLTATDLGAPVAILIGGEGHGLSAAVIDAADIRVTIPLAPQVESLNAAVTAALVAYEARRQRG